MDPTGKPPVKKSLLGMFQIKCETCGCYLPEYRTITVLTDTEIQEYVSSLTNSKTNIYQLCCKANIMCTYNYFAMNNLRKEDEV